jgi:quercetin dioxygenase-like cupin family protein
VPDVDRIALIAALEDEGLLVTEWTDDAGASYEPHTHEQLEVRVVIEGSMTIVAGGRELVLRPGDRIDIAPRQPHAAHVGPEGVRYLAGSLRLQSSSLR